MQLVHPVKMVPQGMQSPSWGEPAVSITPVPALHAVHVALSLHILQFDMKKLQVWQAPDESAAYPGMHSHPPAVLASSILAASHWVHINGPAVHNWQSGRVALHAVQLPGVP